MLKSLNYVYPPITMEEYYTIYPHGHTIFESYIEVVNEVNKMIDVVNNSIEYFNTELSTTVDASVILRTQELTQRLNNLLITPVPVGEIVAEEIIDARQGSASLGENLTSVKLQLTQALQEILDARQGEGSLALNLSEIKTEINTNTTELTNARQGESNLISNLTKIKDNAATLAQTSRHRHVKALHQVLSAKKQNTSITVQGDSTGNEPYEWVYKMAERLASTYPSHTVNYRLWNDAIQNYGGATVLQNGLSGEGFITLDGTIGKVVTTPHNSSLAITGDIDIMAHCKLPNWGNGAQTFVSKFGVGGQRSWAFAINSAKLLYFWYSPDGTANTTVFANAPLTAANNDTLYVKVQVDVNNGAGGANFLFWTSPDNVTWTQVGTTVTQAGVISFFNNTSQQVEIGSRTNGSSDLLVGTIYKVIIRNGINNTIVANVIFPDYEQAPSGALTFTESLGHVWSFNGVTRGLIPLTLDIYNASHSGAPISYSLDNTRFNLQTPHKSHLFFINYGHNQGSNVNYYSDYQALCDKILTKYPYAGVVCVGQNPQVPPEVNIKAHAIRQNQIAEIAAQKDYGFIDVFSDFEQGDLSILMADGAHPSVAGQLVWAQLVYNFLNI